MFVLELMERAEPIINFTHTTAFCIILCAGWLLTYLVMSHNNRKMRNQCDSLLRENKSLSEEIFHIKLKNEKEC